MEENLRFMFNDGTSDGNQEKPEVKEKPEEKPTNRNELLRELSKELGINAFKPEEVKAKFDEFNQWKENQKTEREKTQELLDSYKNKEKDWETEKSKYEFKFAALDKNIDIKKLDKLIKVTDGDATKIDEVLTEFPSFLKTTQTNPAQLQLDTKKEQPKEEGKGAVYEAWLKKRGKK